MKTPYIACAAIWFKNDQDLMDAPYGITKGWVLCGHNHKQITELYARMTGKVPEPSEMRMMKGFLTSDDCFVSRKSAAIIALKAGQVLEKDNIQELTSEDIYKPF